MLIGGTVMDHLADQIGGSACAYLAPLITS